MTGSPCPEMHQRGQEAGAEFFLPKPFPFDQIVSTVRAALALATAPAGPSRRADQLKRAGR